MSDLQGTIRMFRLDGHRFANQRPHFNRLAEYARDLLDVAGSKGVAAYTIIETGILEPSDMGYWMNLVWHLDQEAEHRREPPLLPIIRKEEDKTTNFEHPLINELLSYTTPTEYERDFDRATLLVEESLGLWRASDWRVDMGKAGQKELAWRKANPEFDDLKLVPRITKHSVVDEDVVRWGGTSYNLCPRKSHRVLKGVLSENIMALMAQRRDLPVGVWLRHKWLDNEFYIDGATGTRHYMCERYSRHTGVISPPHHTNLSQCEWTGIQHETMRWLTHFRVQQLVQLQDTGPHGHRTHMEIGVPFFNVKLMRGAPDGRRYR